MPSEQDALPRLNEGPLSDYDAGEELLRRMLPPEQRDAAKPSEPVQGKVEDKKSDAPKAKTEEKATAEKPEADDEDDADESAQKPSEDTDDEEADETEEEKVEAEHVFKIKVGEEEHEVPASKLTRLYGQEQALNKKSMEVAGQRKAYETKLEEQLVTTQAILARAQERFKPYADLDFNILATQVTPEEYTAVRKAAQAAAEEVQFLEKHTADFVQHIRAEKQAEFKKAAVKAVEELSGPAEKGGIEGWSDQLYNDIRAYAVSKGAPAEEVNMIVAPWAMRMMHSAMLYEKSATKGAVKTIKVVNKPKKVVKTTNAPPSRTEKSGTGVKQSHDKLRSTGNIDDAEAVFLARMMAGKPDQD